MVWLKTMITEDSTSHPFEYDIGQGSTLFIHIHEIQILLVLGSRLRKIYELDKKSSDPNL